MFALKILASLLTVAEIDVKLRHAKIYWLQKPLGQFEEMPMLIQVEKMELLGSLKLERI